MAYNTLERHEIEYDPEQYTPGEVFIEIRKAAETQGLRVKWFHFIGGPLDGAIKVFIFNQSDYVRCSTLFDKEQGYNYTRTREDENNVFYEDLGKKEI